MPISVRATRKTIKFTYLYRPSQALPYRTPVDPKVRKPGNQAESDGVIPSWFTGLKKMLNKRVAAFQVNV
jgi:hypothetical protein